MKQDSNSNRVAIQLETCEVREFKNLSWKSHGGWKKSSKMCWCPWRVCSVIRNYDFTRLEMQQNVSDTRIMIHLTT